MLGCALIAARKFVQESYPDCQLAILAGSVVRGEGNENSDLDIVIINKTEPSPYRKSLIYDKWPIEVFVYDDKSFDTFCDIGVQKARPFLMSMIVEGIPIVDTKKNVNVLKREFEDVIKKGPKPLSDDEIKEYRLKITEMVEDLKGSSDHFESTFIVNRLSFLLSEFVMRLNRHWIGEGKWMHRELIEFDSKYAERFNRAFASFYSNKDKDRLIEFVEENLASVGGFLFSGYRDVR
ncbi:nucleotidyltransferase domain-containing protein [Proteinivorax hydrogeniformans]|uniref:Nucleotidyltransferase domain-containing protein n=1 Tax=Proteinivorax hydrogeniformans TaxID=1826727 RepID=A0AAU8HVX5_9FIRM